jgi:hypothetical protein
VIELYIFQSSRDLRQFALAIAASGSELVPDLGPWIEPSELALRMLYKGGHLLVDDTVLDSVKQQGYYLFRVGS